MSGFRYVDIQAELKTLFQQHKNVTKVAEVIKQKYKIESAVDSVRRGLSTYLHLDAALAEECETVGIPVENVSNYWYKGKHYSIHAKPSEADYFSAIKDIVSELPSRTLKVEKPAGKGCEKACKVTLADMHVGMDTNPDGKGLFTYEYNGDVFRDNLKKVYEAIQKEYKTHGTFDVIFIDDLGDGLDGFNGLTTRGGHALPQNMDNVEAFKTYVYGKLDLVEMVLKARVAKKIIVRNVSQCNHAGSFGHIANTAIQMVLERLYKKSEIEYYTLEKFLESFTYGDHAFVLTHGKDPIRMKQGLPYKLDDKTIKFIEQYIEYEGIKAKYIHVEKGDLHQLGYARTKRFDYRNFMSFAPPSAYGQFNFGDGYGGFSIQVIPKHSGEISHSDYIFEFTKLKKTA